MAIRIEPLSPNSNHSSQSDQFSIAPPEITPPLLRFHPTLANSRIEDLPDLASIKGGADVVAAALPATVGQMTYRAATSSPSNESISHENWSNSLQTLLDRPPPSLPSQLVFSGVAFCSALAAWSFIAQIDEVGRAQGRLVPQGETYKVAPVVSGKIANLYVQEGQSVKAGQIIASLDNEIALNRVQWAVQSGINYQKELLQVSALIDKARMELRTNQAIAQAEIKAQESVIAQTQAKIENQTAAIAQAENQVETGQLLLTELRSDISLQNDRVTRFESLANEGALAREQVLQAQQQLGERQRSITQQIGEIEHSRAEVQRMKANLQQLLEETRQLRAELDLKYAEAHNAQIQSQQKIQQLQVQKTELQAKVQDSQKQLVQAKTELEQLKLRAPVNGYVSTLNPRRNGEVAQAGQLIAEIAPEGAPLILSAVLPTKEAGLIKVGESVQIKFDAYPYQDYGIISGQVISISPDVKADEKLGAVYRIEISIDRKTIAKDGQLITLKAGQTATAEIITRHRRIADILLDPIRKMQQTNLNL